MGFGPSGSTRSSARLSTLAPPVEESPDVLDARAFENRVARAVAERRFLAVSVAPRRALPVAAELERRFGLNRISIDALFIRAMKAAATSHDVEWLTVRATDAAGPKSAEWSHLCTLAGMAWTEVEALLRQAPEPLLLENVGLIGRYGLMGRLDVLRADCGTARGPQGLVVLVPMILPGMPAIDGQAVPVMTSQRAFAPDAWLNNVHRAGRAA